MPDVIVRYKQNMQHEVQAGRHRWVVDEPAYMGGEDAGPDPYDLLMAALGACTSMTLMMYARRKQWPLESIQVALTHNKIYARDCQTCETETGRIDRIQLEVTLYGPLSADQVKQLDQVAHRCPVRQTLLSEIEVIKTVSLAGLEGAVRQ